MIIQCLSCGKSISSQKCHCPYCVADITNMTLEKNGIMEKATFSERMREVMLTLVANK